MPAFNCCVCSKSSDNSDDFYVVGDDDICLDCYVEHEDNICDCCGCLVDEEEMMGCCQDGNCGFDVEHLCKECGTWDKEEEVWRCPQCQEEHEDESSDSNLASENSAIQVIQK